MYFIQVIKTEYDDIIGDKVFSRKLIRFPRKKRDNSLHPILLTYRKYLTTLQKTHKTLCVLVVQECCL